MIEVSQLSKDYGPIKALDGVSFKVEKGEVVGFLGPNGAGKTTCMKIITGFLAASSGTVTVDGKDVVEHGVAVRKRLGYLPENAPLYPDMTVREYLAFVADLREVPKDAMSTRIKEVAMTVGIVDRLEQEIGTLSKGYRQRAGLAQAMIHNPEILILDEPTSGLDPNQIVEIRSLIKEVGKDRTVILSTHNLPEVTATCNRIVLIHRGKLVADGTPESISKSHGGGNTFRIELDSADPVAAKNVLLGIDGVKSVNVVDVPGSVGAVFRVSAVDERDLRKDLFSLAVTKGLTVLELQRERLDLETIFQRLTVQ